MFTVMLTAACAYTSWSTSASCQSNSSSKLPKIIGMHVSLRQLTHLCHQGTSVRRYVTFSNLLMCAGTQQQTAGAQERLTKHLEASQAMQTELLTLQGKAAKSEAALHESQIQVQRLTQEVEQVKKQKDQAEQQVGELKGVEGQLELEVARLQHQLQGVEEQLQVCWPF